MIEMAAVKPKPPAVPTALPDKIWDAIVKILVDRESANVLITVKGGRVVGCKVERQVY